MHFKHLYLRSFRLFLFPISILYGIVIALRNLLYDKKVITSVEFNIPIICVGNISVGGTGKSPMVMYLAELLKRKYPLATLSRGYKRHSKGFVIADLDATPQSLGDEPFQMHRKFPNINVAVDANRKNGIEQLLSLKEKPQVILLDDAFQHRKVKAGFYILLTAYNDLYCNDLILPTGNLRESHSGAHRANMIIVTKCPDTISEIAQDKIRKQLKAKQPVFFSTIAYDESVYSENESKKVAELKGVAKLLIAGIAKPEPFFAYLHESNDTILTYSDHHDFSENDIQTIKKLTKNKIIITTEKDYVRLKDRLNSESLFYLPIKTALVSQGSMFDSTLLNYVGTSTRNG